MALVVKVSFAMSSYSMALGLGWLTVGISPSDASSASTLASTSGCCVIMNLHATSFGLKGAKMHSRRSDNNVVTMKGGQSKDLCACEFRAVLLKML